MESRREPGGTGKFIQADAASRVGLARGLGASVVVSRAALEELRLMALEYMNEGESPAEVV